MNHSIMITVDGYSWTATAHVHHNGKQRTVDALSCQDVPLQVHAVLADHLIDSHDVLELVRNYLNDTATVKREATCEPIEVSWYPLAATALREDLTGKTYHVKLTDTDGGVHHYDCGAASSVSAITACAEALGKGMRSSVVQPLGY